MKNAKTITVTIPTTQYEEIKPVDIRCPTCQTDLIIDSESYLYCQKCGNIAPLTFDEYIEVFIYLGDKQLEAEGVKAHE